LPCRSVSRRAERIRLRGRTKATLAIRGRLRGRRVAALIRGTKALLREALRRPEALRRRSKPRVTRGRPEALLRRRPEARLLRRRPKSAAVVGRRRRREATRRTKASGRRRLRWTETLLRWRTKIARRRTKARGRRRCPEAWLRGTNRRSTDGAELIGRSRGRAATRTDHVDLLSQAGARRGAPSAREHSVSR
jgi:hypothetical protein